MEDGRKGNKDVSLQKRILVLEFEIGLECQRLDEKKVELAEVEKMKQNVDSDLEKKLVQKAGVDAIKSYNLEIVKMGCQVGYQCFKAMESRNEINKRIAKLRLECKRGQVEINRKVEELVGLRMKNR